ncbi:YdcF family protein [Sulfuriroseicoccus oceanibius]|uniref:YdcF family protein n=1 Tax=Sulfuriroseicoccus oceanibius TaxID=2707525 RepID=A0A6B3LFN0_9BACT|nr:YdcF family protein [Sulfuriroseicoccus oceanibius]QQL45439.1 YdcF family protein [Sulfuriroseicoccus oceanibius]
MLAPELKASVESLWAYHQLNHTVSPADAVLVFGSNDLRVAEHAARLVMDGLAPWLLFSGARGRMTGHWDQTEAEAMAAVALAAGVPESAILIENRATNTGENIRFSRELLADRNLTVDNAIVVQKPYMERRTIAALDVQWPELNAIASSPPLPFDAYCTDDLPQDVVIAAMVGDFQRIVEYPAKGFASEQPIPPDSRAAYQNLVAAGYSAHLI